MPNHAHLSSFSEPLHGVTTYKTKGLLYIYILYISVSIYIYIHITIYIIHIRSYIIYTVALGKLLQPWGIHFQSIGSGNGASTASGEEVCLLAIPIFPSRLQWIRNPEFKDLVCCGNPMLPLCRFHDMFYHVCTVSHPITSTKDPIQTLITPPCASGCYACQD